LQNHLKTADGEIEKHLGFRWGQLIAARRTQPPLFAFIPSQKVFTGNALEDRYTLISLEDHPDS
jgi:hypothetical protein